MSRPQQIEGPKHKKRHRSAFTVLCKKLLHRLERRRAKKDPEAAPWYRRFRGWEW